MAIPGFLLELCVPCSDWATFAVIRVSKGCPLSSRTTSQHDQRLIIQLPAEGESLDSVVLQYFNLMSGVTIDQL